VCGAFVAGVGDGLSAGESTLCYTAGVVLGGVDDGALGAGVGAFVGAGWCSGGVTGLAGGRAVALF